MSKHSIPKNANCLIMVSICLALCLPTFCLYARQGAASEIKSRVIVGATIIDGSGRRGFQANLRIEEDRITEIGHFDIRKDDRVINARGLTVAPGFIDIHNHSEEGIDSEPTAASQVSQGITTLAVGPDGSSPWPIADYLTKREKRGAAVNILAFAGHATIRLRVMGNDYNRAATAEEIQKMAGFVERAMHEGAVGLSTGLEYDVGYQSTTEEIIELARVASHHGGIYMSHIRDEAQEVISAISEAIRIGREAHIAVQISHIKMGTVGVWGKASNAIRLIAAARRRGIDITADCYPYDAWASTITVLVPDRRHDDPISVRRGIADVAGARNILITGCRAHPDFEGKTLLEVARSTGMTPVEAYIQIVKDGGAGVVCRSMKEADIRAFYRQPWVMVASDGGIGSRHPRGAGAFPRALGLYARVKKWLTLEEAIRKMTSLPAARLGLTDRGLIREGMKADLVIFNPRRVRDRSTFKEPGLLSSGIDRVFVNGVPVWQDGRATGKLSGLVIRKNSGR